MLFNGLLLINEVHKECEDYDFNYPKSKSDKITFNKDNSPWKYRNRIAYTFNAKEWNCKYVDNELWVSSLENYRNKFITRTFEIKECETGYEDEQVIILYSAPNAFYNNYYKTPGAKNKE